MSEERMYYLRSTKTGEQHLIVTTHPSRAVRHVTATEWEVSTPTALRCAQIMAEGIKPVRVEEHHVITE